MKDAQIQNTLARVTVFGTLFAAGLMLAGLLWFLSVRGGMAPGDHVFGGEPKYFETPLSMLERAFQRGALGERRSVVMLGVMVLLISPVVRVGFALVGFAAQKDRLYAAISLIVFAVLLFSFFW